jgi:hypothetical protein
VTRDQTCALPHSAFAKPKQGTEKKKTQPPAY